MSENLSNYLASRAAEFDQIPAPRRELLQQLADFVVSQRNNSQPVQLTFICTHNSRRSHLSQVWAAVAAHHYGIEGVMTFSGGTEATAFNPRAVDALRRAGLQIPQPSEQANPRYHVSFSGDEATQPLECFSKRYDSPPNPQQDFCAIMTCSDADEACPLVAGAVLRLPIRYEDPKVADNTPQEAATYDERCRQIAREMLYVFAQVAAAGQEQE